MTLPMERGIERDMCVFGQQRGGVKVRNGRIEGKRLGKLISEVGGKLEGNVGQIWEFQSI